MTLPVVDCRLPSSPTQLANQESSTGLYVHIPFCRVKCRYCDFAAFPGRVGDLQKYLGAVKREIGLYSGQRLETVYVGGGTPTILTPENIRNLFSDIRRAFSLSRGAEISVECNPENTDSEKLEAFRETSVNRLSFGLQAVQDDHLRRLGRQHDLNIFERAYAEARTRGFDNLNVDLIYGIPEQTIVEWRDSVNRVVELNPEHVSIYALTVEDKTAFGRAGVSLDQDLQADMYEWAADRLEQAGYIHYEISNFARPGRECRHNLRYWRNETYIGVGVSAASLDAAGSRSQNSANLSDYLSAIENGKSAVVFSERLPEPEKVGETLILSLRLKGGISLTPRSRELYGRVLDRYVSMGFLRTDINRNYYRPTRLGWLLSNRLFQDLLTPAA